MEPKGSSVQIQRYSSESVPIDAPVRLPRATIITLSITIVVTGLQLIYPQVLSALRRDPSALTAGEWWRMITPLFVHSDGWVQIITNLIGIAVVGPLFERLFGSWRWLALYFVSGVIAEVISYSWEPYGAGASIALCGLIGGLLVWLFKYHQPVRTAASLYIVYLLGALVGYAIGLHTRCDPQRAFWWPVRLSNAPPWPGSAARACACALWVSECRHSYYFARQPRPGAFGWSWAGCIPAQS